MDDDHHRGGCLCGAVRFEVSGDLPDPDACHCTRCRKSSGHFFVSTDLPKDRVTIAGEANISWFATSAKVRRGFCSTCGSQLFWDPVEHDWIGIAMGAFETPTQARIGVHVHVASKGDYYEIQDGAPQYATTPKEES